MPITQRRRTKKVHINCDKFVCGCVYVRLGGSCHVRYLNVLPLCRLLNSITLWSPCIIHWVYFYSSSNVAAGNSVPSRWRRTRVRIVLPLRSATAQSQHAPKQRYHSRSAGGDRRPSLWRLMAVSFVQAVSGGQGLPVAVQCVALPWQDELCLRFMKEVEKVTRQRRK